MVHHSSTGALQYSNTQFAKIGGDIWRRRYVATVAYSHCEYLYTRTGKGKFLWWAVALGILLGLSLFASISHHIVQPLSSPWYFASVATVGIALVGCAAIWLLNSSVLQLHADSNSGVVILTERLLGIPLHTFRYNIKSTSLLIGELVLARARGKPRRKWIVAISSEDKLIFIIASVESQDEADRIASDCCLLEWCENVSVVTDRYLATVGAIYI